MRPEEPLRMDIGNWEAECMKVHVSTGPRSELQSQRMERFLPLSGKGVQELGSYSLINTDMHLSMRVPIEARGQSSGASHLMF